MGEVTCGVALTPNPNMIWYEDVNGQEGVIIYLLLPIWGTYSYKGDSGGVNDHCMQ